MSRLRNKVAIITGGARGMGGATSRLFVAEGAKVVIADVLDDDGGKLAAELGDNALFVHHDVSQEGSWHALLEAAVAKFGGVAILVNNAGVLLFKSIAETSIADFDSVIDRAEKRSGRNK